MSSYPGDEWEREKPTVKQDKEVKPSVKDFLKQAKKECAARECCRQKQTNTRAGTVRRCNYMGYSHDSEFSVCSIYHQLGKIQ